MNTLIRAFIDYVYIANRGQGRISIANSPIKEVDFNQSGTDWNCTDGLIYLNDRYNLAIDVIDFRNVHITAT